MKILKEQDAQALLCPLHLDKRILCQVKYCMHWIPSGKDEGYCKLTERNYEIQSIERLTLRHK